MKRFSNPLHRVIQTLITAFALLPVVGAFADPSITPAVQEMEMYEGRIELDDSWAIIADLSDSDESFNADYLQGNLVKDFGLQLPVFDASSSRSRHAKRIVIGKPRVNARIEKIASKKKLQIDTTLNEEGYLFVSSSIKKKSDIFVLGNKSAGVFYGIQSLLRHPDGSFQSLFFDDGRLMIEQFSIRDWPDKSVRGAIFKLSKDHGLSVNLEWIDMMARLKMNMVVMGEDTSELIQADLLYDYARRRYMKSVPFLRGLEISPFVREDVNIAEGLPVVDELFQFTESAGTYTAEPLNPVYQDGVIVNADFENRVDQFSNGWAFSGSTHWIWDTTESHSGVASVRMHVPQEPELDSVSDFLKMTADSYIPVEGGKTYTISFWAKGEDLGGKRLPYIRTTQFTESMTPTQNVNRAATTIRLPGGSSDWRQYFQPIYVAEDTRYLRVVAAADAGSYGTVWLDEFELRSMNGSLVNVIRTESSDIDIYSMDGSTRYDEGVDYRVVDGDLLFGTVTDDRVHRFYPLNTPTRIELLPGSAIDASSVVKISYDFLLMNVTGASSSPAYSINDERTYSKHVFPYLEEMVEALDPEYVLYAGASEVSAMNRDRRNGGMQNYELLAKDINNIYGRLKQINPKLRVFLWDDMMNPWHYGDLTYYQSTGGGRAGATEPKDLSLPRVTDLIPREDIIQWVWQYNEDDSNGKRANSGDYFESKSFQWIASSKLDLENIKAWSYEISGREACLGMINWTLSGLGGVEETASRAWNNADTTR